MKYLLLTRAGYIKIEVLSWRNEVIRRSFLLHCQHSHLYDFMINYIETLFYHFIDMKTNFIPGRHLFEKLYGPIGNVVVFLK